MPNCFSTYLTTVTDSLCKKELLINELHEWMQRWLLKLNISKCKVISFGRHVDKFHKYNFTNLVTPIERDETITYLGILMDEKLSFKEHIHNKINKA